MSNAHTLTRLSALAPAKLNLFLHVTGQRDDGYHQLQTLFQLLEWGDEMLFESAGRGEDVALLSSLGGVKPEDNLILRAANLLKKHAKQRGHTIMNNVNIRIKKHIPMGGGLGGGSSNAATTLKALNQLWQTGLSTEELAAIGLHLGADVPVFVHGRTAWAEGVGEKITAVDVPERWYVVLLPNCHVSTQEIFAAPELTRNTPAITMSAFFAGQVRNDLQSVVTARFAAVREAIELLASFGPAMMTGSGAGVFVAVDSESAARNLAAVTQSRVKTVVARGINHSPEFIAHCN